MFNSIIYKLKIINLIFFTIIVCIFFSCKKTPENPSVNQVTNEFYLGADLSYVNEMEDCGAYYKNSQNEELDVFKIFKDHGANLVRVRLWHSPTWTNYSNLEDVKKTIQRAKNYNLQVLLDFHYSDTWADPNQQEIPQAWESYLTDDTAFSNISLNPSRLIKALA